jgi:Tfp pilus assembly PilM family ATPase
LASAVELEAAQVCPFDLQEGAVSFQVLHGAKARKSATGADRTTGILAAAKKAAITRLQDLCKKAKAHCTIVDVEGLALLNCLEACGTAALGCRSERMTPGGGGPTRSGPAALVLNLGSAYTNLAILSDDGQPFVQDIAYAGAGIIEAIGQSAQATPEAVIAALSGAETEAGIAPETLRPAVQQACATLAQRVLETVRYHGARQAGAGVDKILLCGGLAEAGPVVETLGTLLDGKAQRWNPLSSLRCTRAVRKGPLSEHGPLFGVALGLAMRSVRDVPD